VCLFFFQAEDGIRDFHVTGVQTCALPIYPVTVELPCAAIPVRGRVDAVALEVAVTALLLAGVVTGGTVMVREPLGLEPDAVRRQIGRASCRERGESAGGGVCLNTNEREVK